MTIASSVSINRARRSSRWNKAKVRKVGQLERVCIVTESYSCARHVSVVVCGIITVVIVARLVSRVVSLFTSCSIVSVLIVST